MSGMRTRVMKALRAITSSWRLPGVPRVSMASTIMRNISGVWSTPSTYGTKNAFWYSAAVNGYLRRTRSG